MLDARQQAEMPIWIAVAMKGILHATYGEAVVVTPEEIHNWLNEHLGLDFGGRAIGRFMASDSNRYKRVQQTFGTKIMLTDELPVQDAVDQITMTEQHQRIRDWWDSKPDLIKR